MTTTVHFDLNPEAAGFFQEASAEARKKITTLFSALITQQARNPRSLADVMDDMSGQAVANGLTEEKLKALLDER
jgi:predicted KAP-like P-loop ATPase